MRPITITEIAVLGACPRQVKILVERYPQGLAWPTEDFCVEVARLRVNFDWLAERFLTAAALDYYRAQRDQAGLRLIEQGHGPGRQEAYRETKARMFARAWAMT